MRGHFERFGEILEAIDIADKGTGRSKGYGFVTFPEAEAAMTAGGPTATSPASGSRGPRHRNHCLCIHMLGPE